MSYALAHTVFDVDDASEDILHDLLTDQWCSWMDDDGNVDWDALASCAAVEAQEDE